MVWVSNPLHSAIFFCVGHEIGLECSVGPEYCVSIAALLTETMGHGIVFCAYGLYIHIYIVWLQ